MRTIKSALILASLALLFAATGSLAVSAPRAGTWYVAPPPAGNDGNDCATTTTPCATINAALNKPSFVAGDTVRVAVGTYTGSGSEVVLLNKDATLSGGWNATFTTQNGASIIDGLNAITGLNVLAGVTATIERFTVQNGYYGAGAGMNNAGNLSLLNSTITRNRGGIQAAGISSTGHLTLTNSTVSQNSSAGPGTFGIGIYNSGTLVIANSAISSNQLHGIVNWGSATLYGSTVSGNGFSDYYYGPGAGIFNAGILILNDTTVNNNTVVGGYEGGGIANTSGGRLFLNNSTISGNIAGEGGGIWNTDGSSRVTLSNSTITNNTSRTSYLGGGGIFVAYGTVTIQDSIIANNVNEVYQDQVPAPDCSGSISSEGYNIVRNTQGCNFSAASGDLVNVDPKLGLLQDNGGSTYTHALSIGSPAIDAGNPSGCVGSGGLLATDQRGLSRFGKCDIGAYEFQPIDASAKLVNPSTILAGTSATANYAINLRNIGVSDLINVLVTDTLPSIFTYVDNSLTASDGTYEYNNGVITWDGTVNAGGTVTIGFSARISPSVPPNSTIANTAQINVGGIVLRRTANIHAASTMLYIPLLTKNHSYAKIYGTVKNWGTPIAGVPLDLRFYNGSTWSTYATTSTAADGKYIFTASPLNPGQIYYVRYSNIGTVGRVSFWRTRALASFTGAGDVAIGDFDVADITLTAPSPGATVALPYAFQWNPRPATPSDSYEFNLFDPYTGSPWWWTSPLGYVGSYTLTGLPSGFSTGVPYCWAAGVYSPDGGYGMSYYCYFVRFSNAGLKPAGTAPLRTKNAFGDLSTPPPVHIRPK